MAEQRPSANGPGDASYSVGAVVRLTGLSEHLLRAWERRYQAIQPRRTPGGSRRYSEADVERLRLLKQGTEVGHPISELAGLPNAEIEERVWAARPQEPSAVEEALAAATRVDAAEVERILATQFAALGPTRFARQVALPLFEEVGARWARGELSIASEHTVTSVARTLLGTALRSSSAAAGRAPLLFTTPTGERHELGLLVAALVAVGVGARVIYLGPELPASELARAAEGTGARAVALGLVALEPDEAQAYLAELREELPRNVELWLGGSGARRLPASDGAIHLHDLDELGRRASRP